MSQYATPLLINDDNEIVKFERAQMSGTSQSSGYDETWLQNLLFENPSILPIEEIDRTFMNPIPVCRELFTPVGPLDVLYVTLSGKLAILEVKLWRNPQARREVVGQILDYANELSRWDYEDLQREVSRRTKRQGNVLYEIARENGAEISEADFVDEVARSLQNGDFLLLVCGDGIREGVASIAEFLDVHGSLQFTFGLLEMGIYRSTEIGTLVAPRVLAKTEIISRTVVFLSSDGALISHTENQDEDLPVDPTPVRLAAKIFWEKYLERLRLDDVSQPLPKASTSYYLRFNLPSGPNGRITVYRSSSDQSVGVFARFPKTPAGNRLFQHLLDNKEKIEEELDIPIEWNDENEHNTIIAKQGFTDVYGSSFEDEMIEYLVDRTNRFINVFRPEIERFIANE